jgi:hypothetical protein
MKHLLRLAIFALGTAFAFGQEAPPVNTPDPSIPQYNEKSEVKLAGVIQAVKNYDCAVSGTKGGHITLKADNETIEVHLAPTKFMEDFGIQFHVGETVTIVGTKAKWHDGQMMMARTVERNADRFFFRDEQGKPYWN